MIRTGDQYRDSLRDGREVYMDGVRVEDIKPDHLLSPTGKRLFWRVVAQDVNNFILVLCSLLNSL